MLILELKLWSAKTMKTTTLAKTTISLANVNKTHSKGDYHVLVGRRGVTDLVKIHRNPQREGAVIDYPRKSYNVWRLVIRALLSAFPEEKAK